MSQRMTDERLAEIERKFHDDNRRINEDTGVPVCINPDIIELLQALKAERQEVERLRQQIERHESAIASYRADRDSAERELARVRAVVPVLQEGARYCNENDRHPERAGGIEWALGKLEAALQSAAGPGSNQPELDNTKSEG